jgi:hypothetical protein
MAKYRTHLPQLDGRLFLTDGGIETTLIFNDGFELPHFAAFDLLREARGRAALRQYYARYAAIARDEGVGFILESPTRLGPEARLQRCGARCGKQRLDRADAGITPGVRGAALAHGHQRLRRPARRRLRSRLGDKSGGSRSLPRAPSAQL